MVLNVALHPVLGHLGHSEEGAGGGEGVAGVVLCKRMGVRNIQAQSELCISDSVQGYREILRIL